MLVRKVNGRIRGPHFLFIPKPGFNNSISTSRPAQWKPVFEVVKPNHNAISFVHKKENPVFEDNKLIMTQCPLFLK